MKLVKDSKGNYYTSDRRFYLDRCLHGWDVYEIFSNAYLYSYVMSVDTLSEFRLIMKNNEGGDNHS